jgi:hypothetical protein
MPLADPLDMGAVDDVLNGSIAGRIGQGSASSI